MKSSLVMMKEEEVKEMEQKILETQNLPGFLTMSLKKIILYFRDLAKLVEYYISMDDNETATKFCGDTVKLFPRVRIEKLSGDDQFFFLSNYLELANLFFSPESEELEDFKLKPYKKKKKIRFEMYYPGYREVLDMLPVLFQELKTGGSTDLRMNMDQLRILIGRTYTFVGRSIAYTNIHNFISEALEYFENASFYFTSLDFLKETKKEKENSDSDFSIKYHRYFFENVFQHSAALNQMCELFYFSLKEKLQNKIPTLTEEEKRKKILDHKKELEIKDEEKEKVDNDDDEEGVEVSIAEAMSKETIGAEVRKYATNMIEVMTPIISDMEQKKNDEDSMNNKYGLVTPEYRANFFYYVARAYFFVLRLEESLDYISKALVEIDRSAFDEKSTIYELCVSTREDVEKMKEDPEVIKVQKEYNMAKQAKKTSGGGRTGGGTTKRNQKCSNLGCTSLQDGEKKVKVLRCSRCKNAFYCSQKCQLAHWKSGHKNECVMKQ